MSDTDLSQFLGEFRPDGGVARWPARYAQLGGPYHDARDGNRPTIVRVSRLSFYILPIGFGIADNHDALKDFAPAHEAKVRQQRESERRETEKESKGRFALPHEAKVRQQRESERRETEKESKGREAPRLKEQTNDANEGR